MRDFKSISTVLHLFNVYMTCLHKLNKTVIDFLNKYTRIIMVQQKKNSKISPEIVWGS